MADQVRKPPFQPQRTAQVFNEIDTREPWSIWDPAVPDAETTVEPQVNPASAAVDDLITEREALKAYLMTTLHRGNMADFIKKVTEGNLNFEMLGQVWVVSEVTRTNEFDEEHYRVTIQAYRTDYSVEIAFTPSDFRIQ